MTHDASGNVNEGCLDLSTGEIKCANQISLQQIHILDITL